MENVPVGKEYAGPSGVGRDSIWLTAEDLVDGRDAVVEIKSVMLYPEVTFQGGRKRTNILALKFVGKERVLGLNATNRKTLNKQFGNVTKAWPGQAITLYVSETQLAGETVKCVRIRNAASRAASAAEEFLHGDDEPSSSAPHPPASGASEAVSAAATGAAPAVEQINEPDEVLFLRFKDLAARVSATFNGERTFIKEAPPKSTQWHTSDKALADPSVRVYDGIGKALTVTREQLAEMSAKLQEIL